MKFLFVIDSLGSGGAQRQLVDIATKLSEAGHTGEVLVYHRLNFFKSSLESIGVKISVIVEPNYFKRFIKMRRYIRSGNFNIVISFLDGPNFICELAGFPKRDWKLIVNESNANPRLFRSLRLIVFKYFHLLADSIIFNSKANYEMVKKVNPFLNKAKCLVVYNFINFDQWQPLNSYIPLKKDKLELLVIASHHQRKNLMGLIEGVRLLSDKNKSKIKILWYGDKVDHSFELGLEKIKAYGLSDIFEFHPATKDIVKVAQKVDAVGLFSFYEGLPNALIEGMSVAKPIVASSVSDIPLFINKTFLCQPTMPATIKLSLDNLLAQSPEKLLKIGLDNRLMANKVFSQKKTMGKYLSVILGLCAKE